MSMLSAQIDHLRELAEALDGRYGYQGYEIAMRDAADTIWELRDDLQRTNAENAKLQASNEVIAEDHAALCEQNAKLRELLDFALPIAMYAASAEEGDRIRELMREVEL